jgi:hypothetical protein
MRLVELTQDLIGNPYELGANDCFSLITQYLSKMGVETSGDLIFEGHKVSEYAEDYKSNPKKMMGIAVDYIASVTTELSPALAVAGDILYVQFEDNESLVIDGGNGTIIAATEERGTVVLNQQDYTVKRVFRCQQSH